VVVVWVAQLAVDIEIGSSSYSKNKLLKIITIGSTACSLKLIHTVELDSWVKLHIERYVVWGYSLLENEQRISLFLEGMGNTSL